MTTTSDLELDATKFDPHQVSEQTKKFNDQLMKLMEAGPKWYEIGAAKFREMRWNGETQFPRPTVLPHGRNIELPSRDPSRQIPCRVFLPTNTPEGSKPKGTLYHIHGGGWCFQSEHYQDVMLAHFADTCNLAVVSVGYRLAPEHPYPAGNEDCFDVGEYLVDHAERDFGAKMAFVGGESAGAHLSMLTCFHLQRTREHFDFKGLILNFGAFDLSGWLPAAHHFDQPLVITMDIMQRYLAAYVPDKSIEERRDMWISPFYANLAKMPRMPPAIFTCGTADPLLDDSVMMCAKWQMSGAVGTLKIYPGAPHGFIFFPPEGSEQTQIGLDDVTTFMTQRMSFRKSLARAQK